ncbi:MAG TPA: haloacid dehalogenase, partial [Alphaproteobacteria bacterium]|nr:haloacid dehalogenase [Alphaproteobacteria bacterium]
MQHPSDHVHDHADDTRAQPSGGKCCGGHAKTAGPQGAVVPLETAKDPVCGMTVNITPSTLHLDHDGQAHYFCNPKCRDKFAAAPATYLSPAPVDAAPVAAGTKWTCPMHP